MGLTKSMFLAQSKLQQQQQFQLKKEEVDEREVTKGVTSFKKSLETKQAV